MRQPPTSPPTWIGTSAASRSPRTRGLPYGVRVWLRTRLRTTFRLAALSAVTTLILAYLMLAMPLRALADELLNVYAEGFPGLRPPLALVVLARLVPAGIAVSFGGWASFVAVVVPLVSLVRGPCLARLARPSGRWDDIVTGLVAGLSASFLLVAVMVPTWMVMLGAMWPRADFESLANSTRERASGPGAMPAAERLIERYTDLQAVDPRHRGRFLWHKIQADAIAAQVVGR